MCDSGASLECLVQLWSVGTFSIVHVLMNWISHNLILYTSCVSALFSLILYKEPIPFAQRPSPHHRKTDIIIEACRQSQS